MRLLEIVGGVVTALLLNACKSDDWPARIVDPDPASRAELQRIVSAALNGADVMLADDALTLSSLLIIEPTAYRDAKNNRIMGRELRAPVQFVLIKHGDQCVLESRSTRERWVLSEARCVQE